MSTSRTLTGTRSRFLAFLLVAIGPASTTSTCDNCEAGEGPCYQQFGNSIVCVAFEADTGVRWHPPALETAPLLEGRFDPEPIPSDRLFVCIGRWLCSGANSPPRRVPCPPRLALASPSPTALPGRLHGMHCHHRRTDRFSGHTRAFRNPIGLGHCEPHCRADSSGGVHIRGGGGDVRLRGNGPA